MLRPGWWSVAWANLWRTQRCWWLWSGQAIRGDRRCLRWPIATFWTRVRRLLNFEDRSMKLTMPEGLGLLGVLVVGTSLAFGDTQCRPDGNGESKESHSPC